MTIHTQLQEDTTYRVLPMLQANPDTPQGARVITMQSLKSSVENSSVLTPA